MEENEKSSMRRRSIWEEGGREGGYLTAQEDDGVGGACASRLLLKFAGKRNHIRPSSLSFVFVKHPYSLVPSAMIVR